MGRRRRRGGYRQGIGRRWEEGWGGRGIKGKGRGVAMKRRGREGMYEKREIGGGGGRYERRGGTGGEGGKG